MFRLLGLRPVENAQCDYAAREAGAGRYARRAIQANPHKPRQDCESGLRKCLDIRVVQLHPHSKASPLWGNVQERIAGAVSNSATPDRDFRTDLRLLRRAARAVAPSAKSRTATRSDSDSRSRRSALRCLRFSHSLLSTGARGDRPGRSSTTSAIFPTFANHRTGPKRPKLENDLQICRPLSQRPFKANPGGVERGAAISHRAGNAGIDTVGDRARDHTPPIARRRSPEQVICCILDRTDRRCLPCWP